MDSTLKILQLSCPKSKILAFHPDPIEISEKGFPLELVDKIIAMVDRNEYKRQQAAPGIKITSKNFGRDRRMPISNRFRIN